MFDAPSGVAGGGGRGENEACGLVILSSSVGNSLSGTAVYFESPLMGFIRFKAGLVCMQHTGLNSLLRLCLFVCVCVLMCVRV